MPPLSPRITHPKQWELFQRIDTDRSGQLDQEELFEFFADYADEGIADELIAALDTNGDSTIDFEEFCAGWHRFFAGADTEVASVEEVQAAVRLQAAVRGRRARVELNVRLEAASKIQRATQRFLTSRKAKHLVHALLLRQEERDRLTGTPTRTQCSCPVYVLIMSVTRGFAGFRGVRVQSQTVWCVQVASTGS